MNTIKINGIEKSISGLVSGSVLYDLADITNKDKLFLDIKGELDIPINKEDYIIIIGGENFTVGQADIPDNSELKNKISIKLNGKSIELSYPKIKGSDICKKDTDLELPKLYVDIQNSPDRHIEGDWNLIVRGGMCFITIPASPDDIVDVEECTKNDRKPPKRQSKYRIKIDGEKYISERPHLLGKEILALAGKEWQNFDLQQKFKGGKREAIKPEQEVDLSTKGVERFETVPKQAQQGFKNGF